MLFLLKIGSHANARSQRCRPVNPAAKASLTYYAYTGPRKNETFASTVTFNLFEYYTYLFSRTCSLPLTASVEIVGLVIEPLIYVLIDTTPISIFRPL